jgi:hypothetical protein
MRPLPAGFCCCWLLLLAEYHSDAIQINPSHEWLRHSVWLLHDRLLISGRRVAAWVHGTCAAWARRAGRRPRRSP